MIIRKITTMGDQNCLWTPGPAKIAGTNMAAFAREFGQRIGADFQDYVSLHAASVEERGQFWSCIWDFCKVIGERGDRTIGLDKMPGGEFFPDAKLNFAENLLRLDAHGDALVFRAEDQASRRMSWDTLRQSVSSAQQWLMSQGVRQGDRVAAMLPNMPESVILMLATASIGAVWSSCSPDFGVRGVLDRFGQIEPKIFIASDGYFYGGKRIELAGRLVEILDGLPSVESVLVVSLIGDSRAVSQQVRSGVAYDDALKRFPAGIPEFTRLPFNHPLFILFSSGTTGVPKCIVHGAGGTLLQHLKELKLHSDIRPGDRVFYFTTLGWMMWNWLVSSLACGATVLLFDGSPFSPTPGTLFDYAAQERATLFGTSAKFIDSCRKADLKPRLTHDLSSLRLIASTGSPLSAESFRYVYSDIKEDVHLASISGGTDIVSCFVLGDPTSPVFAGEIQRAGLGMAVDVWDDTGKPVRLEKGELVCKKAFPSMPVMFWNDPDGSKYHSAYFERFPGIWCHGDFAEWTVHDGLIIHGRSDATLNPGGVRIGTAEIYAQVEKIPDIIEALAIGQEWDNDIRIVLFVRLRPEAVLTDALEQQIRLAIRQGASPRHVPARIVAVNDIPRTKSGKITELAVREIVHGRDVKNREALANPEALELFREIASLQQ